MPNGRRGSSREVTGQRRIEGETHREYERRVRGREREGEFLPTTTETRRRPSTDDAEVRSATQRLKILEKNLETLHTQAEKAPWQRKHETYAQYRKYYEAEYVPALGQYKTLVTQRREEWLGGLGREAPELTPSELRTIGTSVAHIQRTYAPREQEVQTEKYLSQWGPVAGFRRYQEFYRGAPKPAWEAFYESGVGKFPVVGWAATGMFRGFDPVGKWIAEKVKGREIKVRPPTIKLPSYVEPFAVAGEWAGWYGLGAGVGRVAGFAAPIFGKAFGGAVKTVAISPFTKLAPHISPIVASQWAGGAAITRAAGRFATGTATLFKAPTITPFTKLAPRISPAVTSQWARYGTIVTKFATSPKAIQAGVFGVYGLFETHKMREMYKEGVPPEQMFREVGKDVAMIWGFARGFPKGMEAWGKARTWIESARGMRIPQAEMYEPIIRRGGLRFPTAPRGTSQAQLIREFKMGRYTARELLETMPPEYKHLLKRTWAWHTTTAKFEPIMKVWGKRLSEQRGMYLAPSASPHFYRIPSPYGPPKTTLFGWGTPGRPTAYHIGVTDVLKAWTKTKPGAAHISKAFARRLKFEKEALLFPETLLERLPTKRAYSIWGGRRAVVQVYAAGGMGKPGALLESWARISSRYAGKRALITPREIVPSAYYAKSYARPSAPSIAPSYKPARYAPRSPFSIPSYKPSRRPRAPPSYRAPSYKSVPSIISTPSPPTYPPSYPTYPPTPSMAPPTLLGIPSFFDEGKRKPRAKVPFFDLSKIYRERFFPMELFPMPRRRRKKGRKRRRKR